LDLLHSLNLDNRFFSNQSYEEIDTAINWDAVDETIGKKREVALEFIVKALK